MGSFNQSTLNWLKIKGIRSFDPDQTSEVYFGSPITLLHGQNGAGKTTIIESLKYAITNTLPPISAGSFLHNPRLRGRKKIDSEITLAFTSVHNEQIEIEIRQQVEVKGKKLVRGPNDVAIKRISETGQRDLSTKLKDLKAAAVEGLGVSEAVLNNITLCHHEDANWPLTETSSKLKEKFDDIFDLRKYEDALKKLNEVYKTKTTNLKEKNVKLQFLKDFYEKAEKIKKELENQYTQQEKHENIKKNFEKKLKRFDTEIDKLEKKLDASNQLNLEINKLKTRKEQILNDKNALQSKLPVGSNREDQQNVAKRIEEHKSKLIELQQGIKTNADRRETLQSENKENFALQGLLKQKLEDASREVERSVDYIRAMCEKLNITTTSPIEKSNKNVATLEKLSIKILNKTIQKQKINEDKKSQLFASSKFIDENYENVVKEKAALKETIKWKNDLIENLVRKQEQIKKEINELKSKQSQHSTQGNLNSLKEELKSLKNSLSNDEFIENLKSIKFEIETSKKQAENVVRKLGECFERASRWKNRDFDTSQASATPSESGVFLDELDENLEEERNSLYRLDGNIELIRRIIEEKNKRYHEDEQTSSGKFETNKGIFKAQDHLHHSADVYKFLLSTVKEIRNCGSPIHPHQLDRLITCLNEERGKVLNDLEFMNKFPNDSKLLSLKLPEQIETDAELQMLLNDLKKKRAETNARSESSLKAESFEDSVQQSLNPIQAAKSPNYENMAEINRLMQQKKLIWQKLLDSMKKFESLHANIDDKRGLICRKQHQVIKIQEDFVAPACCIGIKNKIEMELAEQIKILNREKQANEVQLQQSSEKKKNLRLSLKKKQENASKEIEELNKKAVSLAQEIEEMKFASKILKENQMETLNGKFEETRKKVDEVDAQIESNKSESNDFENKMAELRSKQEKLLQNRSNSAAWDQLENYEAQIEEVDQGLKKQRKKLENSNYIDVEKKYDKSMNEKEIFLKSFYRGEGEKKQLEESIKKNEEDLLGEHMRSAEANYRSTLVDSAVLELACQDLTIYCEALDHAFIKMHETKMKTINSVIRHLWQDTYCGTDIEYIELQCDQGRRGRDNRRKNMEYKVVMVCNGVEMDMRGRCSAGQKVLGSLIIRLALAEVFCKKCAVLALDEPTSNLDSDNMEGLVKSLLSVVESRSYSSNLQLIIITHDKRLLEMIGKSRYADHYFKVYKKKENGCSYIEKCRIQRLAE